MDRLYSQSVVGGGRVSAAAQLPVPAGRGAWSGTQILAVFRVLVCCRELRSGAGLVRVFEAGVGGPSRTRVRGQPGCGVIVVFCLPPGWPRCPCTSSLSFYGSGYGCGRASTPACPSTTFAHWRRRGRPLPCTTGHTGPSSRSTLKMGSGSAWRTCPFPFTTPASPSWGSGAERAGSWATDMSVTTRWVSRAGFKGTSPGFCCSGHLAGLRRDLESKRETDQSLEGLQAGGDRSLKGAC